MKRELIAEIGQNHNGDFGQAIEMIRQAKRLGADVAKFQVFDARALFPPPESNPWFEHNLKAELTREQVLRLADECRHVGIEFLASVFDEERIAWLEEAGVRRYKVASRSVADRALTDALVATGKPLIVSLGHWKGPGLPVFNATQPVLFLHCVSKYPATLEEVGVDEVDFGRYAGFSDHTVGLTAAKAALGRGARIIEKHFTLDQRLPGPDHACSMTPGELHDLDRFRRSLEE